MADYLEPVPFRLPMAGDESIGLSGITEVSYRVEGLLHLDGEYVILEWKTLKTTEEMLVTGIATKKDELPLEELEMHVSHLSGAEFSDHWWRRRLTLRARSLDVFDGVPGARPGRLALKIRRRDRQLAWEMVNAIQYAMADSALRDAEGDTMLGDGDRALLEDPE